MVHDNPNLVLVKGICAIYLNRLQSTPNEKLEELIKEAVEAVKMPADTLGEGGDGEIAAALRVTIDWMCSLPITMPVDAANMSARIRINCSYTAEYIETIEELTELSSDLSDAEREEIIKTRIQTIVSEIKHFKHKQKLSSIVSSFNRKLNFTNEFDTLTDAVREINEQLHDFDALATENSEIEGEMLLSDIDSVIGVLERSQELMSTEGILKTGLQGLNDSLGVGGHRRGEFVNYGAITHNYKTGILMDYTRWIPMYNTPYMMDKGKKPLVLRISFENKLEQDIPGIYIRLKEADTREKVDRQNIDVKEAAKLIVDRLGVNGYNVAIRSYDPNTMDVWGVIAVLQEYEDMGYEIHGFICDYLEIITKSTSNMRKDEAINYAFEVLRNHCFPRGITVFNGHQLSTEAIALSREGTSTFAQKIANGSGMYQNSRSLHTKLDCEFIMHIHRIGEDSYLTFAKGKHRGADDVAIRRRSFAYKFDPIGGILDDVNNEKSNAIYSWAEVDSGDSASSLDPDGQVELATSSSSEPW